MSRASDWAALAATNEANTASVTAARPPGLTFRALSLNVTREGGLNVTCMHGDDSLTPDEVTALRDWLAATFV